jgi:hypothetical protein
MTTALAPLANCLPTVLSSRVAKRAIITTFVVKNTSYGWSVGAGTKHVGLFMSQRQALDEVKKRRGKLTATGQRSAVVVRGSEPVITGGRSSRYFRSWR